MRINPYPDGVGSPVFEISHKDHVHAFLFQGGEGWDLMAFLWRQKEEEGPWRLSLRFRIHNSKEAFDGGDKKIPLHLEMESVEQGMQVLGAFKADPFLPVTDDELVIVGGTMRDALIMMVSFEWCHMKSIDSGEADGNTE